MNQIKNEFELTLNELGNSLASAIRQEGFQDGMLSSSALGGAFAVAALWFDNPEKNSGEIDRGLE